MKIAFLLTCFPSLSETFILNQITGLLDLGHDVTIFAIAESHDQKHHPDIERYQLLQRTQYLPPIPRNKIMRVLKAIYLFTRYFRQGGRTLMSSLNILKFGKDAIQLNVFYALLPFLGKQFDIIHCHFGRSGIIGSLLKKAGIGGKYVTTFYGHDLTAYIKKHGEPIYRELFATGDLFLPICQYFKDKLVAYGCPENKIIVHPLGIDLRKFSSSTEKQRADDRINILTIARLDEKKGHKDALKALHRVINSSHQSFHYTIVGDGPLKQSLMEMVIQLQMERYVSFMGSVTQAEVIRFYKVSDLFLHPSITAQNGDQEGTPTAILEAQAMELPVISTYHSGIPEIVLNGQSGFLVPEGDSDALAEKILYVLEHPGILTQAGKRGRKFVEEHYDICQLTQQLVKLYETLCA